MYPRIIVPPKLKCYYINPSCHETASFGFPANCGCSCMIIRCDSRVINPNQSLHVYAEAAGFNGSYYSADLDGLLSCEERFRD
jgi:hypothetical protein